MSGVNERVYRSAYRYNVTIERFPGSTSDKSLWVTNRTGRPALRYGYSLVFSWPGAVVVIAVVVAIVFAAQRVGHAAR